MTNNLAGKVAVVTGSTRGFGYAIARELLRRGAQVVVSGRTAAAVDQAVESLRPLGAVIGIPCDVSVSEQVYDLGREAAAWQGKLDIWVNNAGCSTAAGSVIDFPPQEMLQTVHTNCLGTFNGVQTAFAIMLPAKQGTLVNIYGRGSDLKSASPSGLYGATKAWITSFTRTLAAEVKGAGIQIVGYSPGIMLTDMLEVKYVVGEQVKPSMKNYPMVLKALASPPELPAAELVKLLELNRKPFVEVRFMRGGRALKKIAHLLWMLANPSARPPSVDYPSVPAYRPPG
jgi:NAD(P)-dependent dehydrogenase (short-subunit alcohol dehydrogenase family)